MTMHPCDTSGPGRLHGTAAAFLNWRFPPPIPASSPKPAASAADVVFLDLEDAVAPAAKDQARAQAVAALNDIDRGGNKTMAVRVNGLDTPGRIATSRIWPAWPPRLDLILPPGADPPSTCSSWTSC